MTADTPTPQPTTIQKLATSIYAPFAMLAGMQLDLFTPLKEGAMTAQQLAAALNVKAEKLSPLLYVLVAAELLTIEGERFANTPEADYFLVKGKPTYQGGRHENFSDIWETLLHTADTVRTGIPQAKKDFATTSPDDQMSFFRGLHQTTVADGRELASRYDFSTYRTLVDVGGGSGGASLALTEAYSHLQATVIDLPTVTPITQRFIEEANATDRVQAIASDVVNQPLLSTYDGAILRSFIQVLSPDDAFKALKHIGAAINPGGRIFIVGRILDDSRLSPLGAVGFNLVFLNIFDEGRSYTEGEHREWLTTIGFEDIERTLLPGGISVITARKPA